MRRGVTILAACFMAMLLFGVGALLLSRSSALASTEAETQAAPDGCVMNFSDVPPGSTFYNYIRCLYCEGIVGGYPDGTFRPNNDVTRGQLSKIVVESSTLGGPPGLQIFEDVPPGSTYYTAVNTLVQQGYINGYNCGGPGEPCSPSGYRYFRVNAPATRAQIAKIVTQVAGWYEPAGAQSFEDVVPGSTFYDYVQRLYAHNAAQGYACGGPGEPCGAGNLPYFRPNFNVTRGQISKIDVAAFFPQCVIERP